MTFEIAVEYVILIACAIGALLNAKDIVKKTPEQSYAWSATMVLASLAMMTWSLVRIVSAS